LHKYDPLLHCVVSFTDDLALSQASQADTEIAAGRYRGPLHGIPWGAKDLIAYPGYKTTWGAKPFREQTIDIKATAAQRLDEAGAVLVAKLSLGALAWGDDWFGGVTRNPWNPQQGSSGSSAGSAAATAAGLAGFTLGSETLGSIVSPCRRCGATGLRPTFGRVSRYGCMSLAWSMDKIGPLARSVEDCALVFAAIHGADGLDPTITSRPFTWPPETDLRALRVGYFENQADEAYQQQVDALRAIGLQLQPIVLPEGLPAEAMAMILNVEAATVFDGLTRQNITDGLNRWPNEFYQAELTPAVEYLRANRLRTLLIREMERLFETVDAYLGGDDLVITNLTGHPTVVLPAGFHAVDDRQVPMMTTFTGRLFGEEALLALAYAFEQQVAVSKQRPPLDRFLAMPPEPQDIRP
jgi:Asp-tRNA(Asn)/Glu-tRNA(Gln) amidotransferase A subunit family amidase